ncbi:MULTISPECIES: LysR substrate-binding domain-containing protein [Pseudomonas]|uniref:LysR substrate-binding domain-containing protein n=1 Tax=Pseudomonas TaxID=286 RepID=UPI0020946244|nr:MULTISPECIES: LysR substrate-binding domain-containing protein [Pseudomonas]MCO7037456.1 LysR substrate-binding domain-containing protein [Pseudomonas carnis]MDH0796897.1 LysR substrate-binding domain-containing protein [Pseudomonas carnis]
MKRLPPLPALHTFWVTAQCCNFTRAAEHLHITQGAVSRQVAGLESQLGYALFQRQARGLSLTEEGREWLACAQQVFGLLADAVEHIGDRRRTLQLKASTCVMRWLLPRLLQWQKERPDVPVELTTTVAYNVDFRRETFDAAVIYGPIAEQSAEARHLFDERLTPVCVPGLLGSLRTPQDLQHQVLLHPTRDERDWTLWLKAANACLSDPIQRHHFETLDLAMTVASQGTGVAMGDSALIGEDLKAGRLAMPFELRVSTGMGYFLVYPPGTEPSVGLVALMDWLVSEASA